MDFEKTSYNYVNTQAFSKDNNGSYFYGGVRKLERYRKGEANPLWRQQIANKEPATTNFFGRENTLKIQPGFASGLCVDGSIWTSTFLGVDPYYIDDVNIPQSLVDTAVATARSNAFEKIRKLQEPFQGQVFAGELKEAIMLLRNPFEASQKLLKKLSKSNARVAKEIADQWNEFSFAIVPLIGDINDIIKNVIRIAEIEKHSKFRTYGVDEKATTYIGQNGIGIAAGVELNNTETWRAECFIHFGILAKYLNQHEEFSSRLIDSFDNLSSIPVTAWNLIPGSFLVDYFVNVNDVLNSIVTTQTAVSYVSESVVRTHSFSQSCYNLRLSDGGNLVNVTEFIPRSFIAKSRSVTRTGGQLGIPPVVFSLPGSNKRYANIAALLVSNILNKGKT